MLKTFAFHPRTITTRKTPVTAPQPWISNYNALVKTSDLRRIKIGKTLKVLLKTAAFISNIRTASTKLVEVNQSGRVKVSVDRKIKETIFLVSKDNLLVHSCTVTKL